MEDTDEFKWALKVVIKRQMRDLMEQLRERGEEIAILTVNLEDNSCSHFGSPNGEWFVSEQKNLIQNFLNFCQTKGKNKRTGYTPSYSYYSPAPAASKKPAGFKQKATPTTPDKSAATSADMPLVKVTVPRHLAGDISEEELAGLVGRIVATQLVMQEKGDGSTGGTKFDLLLDAANQSKSKDELSSVMSTPSTRSTRKRKVTAKFREGINSLKKGKKSEEEEDVSEQEASHEDSMIFKILAELSSATLKRVRVKLSDETTVDVEHSMLTSSEKFESLAVQVIQELDEVASGLLTNKKNIKLEIFIEDTSDDEDVRVEVGVQGRKYQSQKQPQDSSDPNMDMDFPELDLDTGDSDVDYDRDVNDSDKGLSETKQQIKVGGLKKQRRRRQPPSAVTPFPCDYCGRQIIGKGNLDIHIKRVHLKKKHNKCAVCPKAFFGNRELESHVLAVHTQMCHMCNEYVAETETWPEGIDMFKARTVMCKCGAQVVFQCKMGRKREFEVEDDAVDIRKRERHEHRQFACSHCGKLFTSKNHCLRHARRHTDVKDIECDYCNETFRYENSLKKHLQKEHRIYSHVCELCNESFASKSDLNVHFKRKHTSLKGSSVRKKSMDSPAVVGGKCVSGASPQLLAKKVTSITQHMQGTNRQEPQGLAVRSPQNPAIAVSGIRVPQNPTVSAFRAPQNPVVAVSVADGESLDSITYNIVQQVLQGNDQVFTEDGKTVIIRTVHE